MSLCVTVPPGVSEFWHVYQEKWREHLDWCANCWCMVWEFALRQGEDVGVVNVCNTEDAQCGADPSFPLQWSLRCCIWYHLKIRFAYLFQPTCQWYPMVAKCRQSLIMALTVYIYAGEPTNCSGIQEIHKIRTHVLHIITCAHILHSFFLFTMFTCSRGCNSERRADVHPFWQRRYRERLDSEQQNFLLN